MGNSSQHSKEIELLSKYRDYLAAAGIQSNLLPATYPENIDLLQVNLINQENLNLLFVPLGKNNFKTVSLIQFYTSWENSKRELFSDLQLINALNQKIPIGKLSLNEENSLEYHYYLAVSPDSPMTSEEFLERIALVLSQLEAIYSIWNSDVPVDELMEKLKEE